MTDRWSRRAKRILDQLITTESIALARGRRVAPLLEALADALESEVIASGDDLAAFLVERGEVDELFADDEALTTLFEALQGEAEDERDEGSAELEVQHYWREPLFSRWMAKVTSAEARVGELVLERRDAGFVDLPTGRLVICDPTTLATAPAVVAGPVPSGRFPLQVLAVTAPDGGPAVTIAFAVVQFARGDVARWEIVAAEGQDVERLALGSQFVVPVDGGVVCYADAHLYDEMKGQQSAIARAAARIPSAAGVGGWRHSGGELVLISAGAGDGSYPSFFGLNARGAILVLVTDFLVVGRPATDERF